MPSIDLNADLGEGFGPWRMGDDDAMLDIVTSANVACGFHAGDQEIMARTFALAKAKGVAVGAHVGFPDLYGFGRRPLPFSAAEIERIVAYQLGAAQALARYSGHRVSYVKCHGALANIAESDRDVACAVARAICAVDPTLALLAIALSEQVGAAQSAGLRAVHEIYADRAYTDAGRLASRREQGAVIEDATAATARALAMLAEGALVTASGQRLPTQIDSICVHGDTQRAVQMARRLRDALQGAGFALAAFAAAR
ncbi:MAG: LamB/YcsF family protein [Methylocystis sp.]|nr:LamB/YcsF family protein [Methylocystis sp.]